MKKKFLVAFLTVLMCAFCTIGLIACGDIIGSSDSDEFVGNPTEGLEFTEIDGGYEVTGIGTVMETDIVIPSTYNGKPVISIYGCLVIEEGDEDYSVCEGAFYECHNITSVFIPNSVTTIGDMAFAYCSNLKTVTISNGVISIGNGVFRGCNSLTNLSIPSSVTSIGEVVFFLCSSLENINIPDSVTSIGWHAFYACENLIINYNGTKAQWNAINEDDWADYAYCTVHCTDGDIIKS